MLWSPELQKRFTVTLEGDDSGRMETAAFTLPFDTREVWGKARVPVKVTINGTTTNLPSGGMKSYTVLGNGTVLGSGPVVGAVLLLALPQAIT